MLSGGGRERRGVGGSKSEFVGGERREVVRLFAEVGDESFVGFVGESDFVGFEERLDFEEERIGFGWTEETGVEEVVVGFEVRGDVEGGEF